MYQSLYDKIINTTSCFFSTPDGYNSENNMEFLAWFHLICLSSNNPKGRVKWNNDLRLRYVLWNSLRVEKMAWSENAALLFSVWKCLRPLLPLLQQSCALHLGISAFPADLHIIEIVVILSQKSLCFHHAFAEPEPEMCHQSSHLCI